LYLAINKYDGEIVDKGIGNIFDQTTSVV